MKFVTVLLAILMVVVFASYSPTAAAPAGPCGDSYLVMAGDTLESIAFQCGVTEDQLLAANPGLQGTDGPTIGRVLFIPRVNDANGDSSSQTLIVPATGGQPADGVILQPTPLPLQQADPNPQVVIVQPQVQPQPILATGASTYIIQPGDTLTQIALRFGTSIEAILAANPQVSDPDLIYAGRQLILPAGSLPVPVTGTPGSSYIIRPGDTLTQIALRFNTSIEAILAANPQISDPDLIYAGRSLTIPGAAPIPPTGGVLYTVQANEDIYAIAARYGLTVEQVLRANPQLARLTPGQQILLPVTGYPAPLPTPTTPPVTQPAVTLVPATGSPGTVIEINVSGFPADQPLIVTLALADGSSPQTFTARSDASGRVRGTLPLPLTAQAGQTWQVTVVAPNGTRAVSGLFTVAGQPIPQTGGDIAAPPAEVVQVYLFEPEPGNQTCGGRPAPALRRVPPTTDPLSAAVAELLRMDAVVYGPSNLYNAFARSDLRLDRLELNGEQANVYLTGDYDSSAVCDRDQMAEQMAATVRFYTQASSVAVFVNGVPIP